MSDLRDPISMRLLRWFLDNAPWFFLAFGYVGGRIDGYDSALKVTKQVCLAGMQAAMNQAGL